MAYEVIVEQVEARPLAAVRVAVPVGQVGGVWRPALDKVWSFLRTHDGLRTDGHNTFVYRHSVKPGLLEVDFGVEVSRAFTGEGEIVLAYTPAGVAARTVHVGAPGDLVRAYGAIEAWCGANHRPLAGVSWEIYGDPGSDPRGLEVRVYSLLA